MLQTLILCLLMNHPCLSAQVQIIEFIGKEDKNMIEGISGEKF